MPQFKVGDFVFCGKYGTYGVITKVTDNYYHLYWISDIFKNEWEDVRIPHSIHLIHNNADTTVNELIEQGVSTILERKEYFLSLTKQEHPLEREILFRPGLTADQMKAGLNMVDKNQDKYTGTMEFYDGQCIIAFLQDRIIIRLAEKRLNEI